MVEAAWLWLIDRVLAVLREAAWQGRCLAYNLAGVVLGSGSLLAAVAAVLLAFVYVSPLVGVGAALLAPPALTCFGRWARQFVSRVTGVVER